jgi:hypothetical protein
MDLEFLVKPGTHTLAKTWIIAYLQAFKSSTLQGKAEDNAEG